MWNIKVQINDDFNSDLEPLINEVAGEYLRIIPSGPLSVYRPITVSYNKNFPIVFDRPNIANYAIGLSIDGNYWNQTVFQFAHEMCHLYCGSRVTNGFIESICCMASFYFLDLIGNKWQTSFTRGQRNYAHYFLSYKNNEISKHLPQTSMLDDYIREIDICNVHPVNDRDKQTIIACKLLSVFENNLDSWAVIPYLGAACEPTPVEPTDYIEDSKFNFTTLHAIVPDHLKPIVKEIADILNINI